MVEAGDILLHQLFVIVAFNNNMKLGYPHKYPHMLAAGGA
jgi:hypothetical protein